MDIKFYKINDAAKILSISRSGLYKLIQQGRIKTTQIMPKRIAISQAEIERFVKSLEE